MRGSAKHVLDLLDREDYVPVMNGLLDAAGITVTSGHEHRPHGKQDPAEGSAEAYCDQLCRGWPNVDQLAGWWPQVMPPQWDLISTCQVNGRRGILLVEAKAHESECSLAGKDLEPDASPESQRNHRQIERCLRQALDGLREARKGLREAQEGLRPFGVFRLSVESHYQLANRVAYLWKLASLGIPTVLLYLGFTGDTYFEYDYLVDADHWQRVMGAYMWGVVPLSFPEQAVQLADGGVAQMIIKSLPVVEKSQ